MLQAKNENGQLITLALVDRQIVEGYRHQQFYCPTCNEKVIIKVGHHVIAHFAHQSNSTCPNSNGGEGVYHETGKLHLYQWLKVQGINAHLEYYIPKIKQRPDILFLVGKRAVALEYQCAPIAQKDFISRTAGYHQLNILPLWVLGGNRLKRIGQGTTLLNPNDLKFIHKLKNDSPLMMYFYCSDTNLFSVFQHIQFTGKKKAYGNLYYNKLTNLNIFDLWTIQPNQKERILKKWLADVIHFRTQSVPYPSRIEKKWRHWLYSKRIHLSLLPSITCLPIPQQYMFNCPAWIWQSKICIELLLPDRVVTKKMCYHLLKGFIHQQGTFPLIYSIEDPVINYLQLLKQLGFLQEISPKAFRVLKPVVFPKHIEEAVKQDKQLFAYLKNLSVSSRF